MGLFPHLLYAINGKVDTEKYLCTVIFFKPNFNL